ncbi:MAG: hypothetical protein GDA48_03755 [Hormoscilla sp. GM102CHS1]|nr:hypothetical protein [Hormoscilla sp. GM102CHS1]
MAHIGAITAISRSKCLANRRSTIECSPNGHWARPAEVCQAAEIEAWEINGKLYTGTQSLEKLADLSGYQGSRQF